jgi:hypothetical protein
MTQKVNSRLHITMCGVGAFNYRRTSRIHRHIFTRLKSEKAAVRIYLAACKSGGAREPPSSRMKRTRRNVAFHSTGSNLERSPIGKFVRHLFTLHSLNSTNSSLQRFVISSVPPKVLLPVARLKCASKYFFTESFSTADAASHWR